MAGYFFDTSALAKFYQDESGSEFVKKLFSLHDAQPYISRLATVEIISVFALNIRTGATDTVAAGLARRRLDADLGGGVVVVAEVAKHHFQSAGHLVDRYGVLLGLRSLDALQIAVALDLRSAALVSVFVSADRRQLRAAQLEGFVVADPENASFSTQ